MTPDGIECLLGRGDGGVNVLSAPLRDLGQDLACRGVYDTADREEMR